MTAQRRKMLNYEQQEPSLKTQEMEDETEIYHGDETCRLKLMLWLEELGFPNGLIALEDIEECGYEKSRGFIWFKHKEGNKEKWYGDMLVRYEAQITAYVGPNVIWSINGVKVKRFVFWLSLSEVSAGSPSQGLLTFKTQTGFSMSFPRTAFELQKG